MGTVRLTDEHVIEATLFGYEMGPDLVVGIEPSAIRAVAERYEEWTDGESGNQMSANYVYVYLSGGDTPLWVNVPYRDFYEVWRDAVAA